MNLKSGERLGRYQLVSQIGEGGMGEVWKARDTQLDRDVAVKVSKDAFTARFEREARAVAAFNHPNICQIYDVGPNYLVMELIDGAPLKGPLPAEKAVAYARLILDALDAAHSKGFVHRDLKPANVLATKQGLKLLDFGLAKQVEVGPGPDDTTGVAITQKGQISGTLQYMSPEQLQGKEADARSDIFAFGCVLYEMLSGARAFQGSTAASVIAEILEREPEPLKWTPPLDRVVRKCLAKDPEERFQTARDLKYNLGLAMETGVVTAPGRARPPWVLFAATAVMAVVVASFTFGPESRPLTKPEWTSSLRPPTLPVPLRSRRTAGRSLTSLPLTVPHGCGCVRSTQCRRSQCPARRMRLIPSGRRTAGPSAFLRIGSSSASISAGDSLRRWRTWPPRWGKVHGALRERSCSTRTPRRARCYACPQQVARLKWQRSSRVDGLTSGLPDFSPAAGSFFSQPLARSRTSGSASLPTAAQPPRSPGPSLPSVQAPNRRASICPPDGWFECGAMSWRPSISTLRAASSPATQLPWRRVWESIHSPRRARSQCLLRALSPGGAAQAGSVN